MYNGKIQIEKNVAMPPRSISTKDRYGILDDMVDKDSFYIKETIVTKKETTAFRQGLLAYAATKNHEIATRSIGNGYRVWMVNSSITGNTKV